MSTIDPETIEAYRNAVYRVRDKDSRIEFFVDSNNAELDNTLRSHSASTAAFITACNPRSQVVSAMKNRQFHENLVNTVEAMQLKRLEGDGGDREGHWEPEKSLLILGISKEAATEIAIDYGQNAFVWIERGRPPELVLTR